MRRERARRKEERLRWRFCGEANREILLNPDRQPLESGKIVDHPSKEAEEERTGGPAGITTSYTGGWTRRVEKGVWP